MQFPKLKSVTAIEKYRLHVAFTDGTEGIYDVGHLAGKGVFKSWDSGENFYMVGIDADSGAITWPGDLDIDTINAYCSIKGITVSSYLGREPYAAH